MSLKLFRRSRTARRTALVPLLAVLLAAGAYPTVASASARLTKPGKNTHGDGRATFGVRPATNGKPDNRATLTYGMTPGAHVTDHVAFVNASLATYTLQAYATDAINDTNGKLTLLAPGTKPTDAGSWITLGGAAAAGRITIKPRSYVVVPVNIAIPQNASPGDHVAGVVSALVAVSQGQHVNVRLNQRVGLRVFIRVAGDVTAKLSIENLSVEYHDNWNPFGSGSATVAYRVHNNGNVTLGAGQTVRISGLFGQVAAVHPAPIDLILPGSSFDEKVQVPGVFPEVWMTAKVELRPVVPAGNVDTGLKSSYSASVSFWAVPWILIAILVGLLLVAVLVWRWLRKRRASAGRHSAPRNGSNRTATPVEAGVST